MLPDRVSNQGPLTYESGALPIALRGPMSVGIFGCQDTTIFKQFVPERNAVSFLYAGLIMISQLAAEMF